MELEQIVAQIKDDKKPVQITPRFLFNSLGCERRTHWNCAYVDKYLSENKLDVDPHYNDVWIDTPIMLTHKPFAKRRSSKDPIKRLKILEAATKQPIVIDNSASINEAITLMLMHGFSQLPVTNNGKRGLCGCVSWETLGTAIVNGVDTGVVKDYKTDYVKVLSLEMPLLSAIKSVYKHEFAVVMGNDNTICGIITTADISSQFLASTEPFVLLEEIENQIRYLFDDKFLLEDIQKVCNEVERKIDSIDDLTFGEYIKLIEAPENWEKLQLKSVDRKLFIEVIDKVRVIRNDIMHFEPAGITSEQYSILYKMSRLLNKIAKFQIK